jgi:Ca2+-binding RTX toxin-like protein
VTVNLGADTYGGGHASGDDLDSIEEVRGSNHGDVLTGSSAAEKLMGAPGNDSVSGAGGNDTLWGGQGDDTLSGGAGNDTLAGGAGSDTFEFSAAGSDFIEAFEQGSDKINIPGLTATQLDALLLTRTAVGTRFQYRHDGLTINTNVQLAASDFVGFAGAPAPAPGSGTPTGNIVGTNGDDVRDGGPGDDTINGLDGNDDLIGRDGDDVLIGGAGFDTLHGWDQDKLGDATRDGIDTASYEDAPTRVIVTLHTAQARTQGGDEAQEWDSDIGGAGDDALSDPGVGMPGAGHARGDVFYSIENLRGSKYHDTLQGDDSVAGDDTGDNKIEGLEGNDHITGLGGNDTLIGGEGHDSLHGGAGDDSLEGGPGEDTLYGAGGDDVLYGGAGADMLCGEDTGTGNDTLVGGEGADTLWGGIASYMGSAAVTINLNDDEPEKGGHAEGDVLVGDDTVTANDVVHIIGSSGHDWLRSRTLSGTAETLEGGDGNDTLVGGDGSDLLDGGEGTDTASYNLFTDSVPDGAQTGNLVVLGEPQTTRVNLTGTGGILRNIENLIGSWGNDTLTGNSGRNKIEGIQGDDTIEGKGGADTLDGGEGTDTLLYETSPEAVTITVSGSGSGSASGAADSHARGDTIKDFEVVIGSDHNDVLRATGSESVTLDGGAGEDTLRGGGSEPVTLNGGTDDDVFYFRNGDTVQDFAAGDKIDLPGSRSSWGKHVHVDSGVLYYDSSGRLFIPEVRNDQGDVTTPEDLTGLPAGFDLSTLPSMTVTGLTSEDDGNFM